MLPTPPPVQALLGVAQYHPSPQFTTTTRHLCAAPYLDADFGEAVISELIEDERRSVAPSSGFDVEPVVRHSFRARKLRIIVNGIVAGLVAIGLCLSPLMTTGWLLIGFAVLTLTSSRMRAMGYGRKLIFAVLAGAALFFLCCGGFATAIIEQASLDQLMDQRSAEVDRGPFGVEEGYDSEPSPLPAFFLTTTFSAAPLVLGIATFVVLLAFRMKVNNILLHELARDRAGSRPHLGAGRVLQRLGQVAAGQFGNIVVHERNPFLGCGEPMAKSWSFALTLRPDGTGAVPELPLDELTASLYDRIRDSVQSMRANNLPDGTRIPNITFMSHLVADGTLESTDRLLNPQTRTPYTLATDEAIEAIRRTPQGGLRYYERILVAGPGNPVRTRGEVFLPPRDPGIDISVFVHVAIEGGMLYTEFISTVLPPIRAKFEAPDTLHPQIALMRAVQETVLRLPGDTAASLWRAISGLYRTAATRWRMVSSNQNRELARVNDYGAQLSVRELGADPVLAKYLHLLDHEKYVKLVERAVSDAILRFLQDNGYDVAEFSTRVNHIQNFHGDFKFAGGQQSFGANATMKQGA